jgi:hypothetical protein
MNCVAGCFHLLVTIFFHFYSLLLGPLLLLNYDFAGCFTAGHLLNPGISATAE